MHVHILLFGIIADLTGESKISLAIEANATVKNLKTLLKEKYPQLNSYNTYAVAVNESYVLDDVLLKDSDTIAIIPPVSGG